MKLNSGEFETKINDGVFYVRITEESDISLDGGHTHECVTNTFELDVTNAKHLIEELQEFVNVYT